MKTLKSFTLIFIIVMSFKTISAQTREWVARDDGPEHNTDIINDITTDDTGNLYVTGLSAGINTVLDFWTVKYDPTGARLWNKRYNGPGNEIDNSKSIAVDQSGNVYVTGNSRGTNTYSDFATIKYNSAGVQQWVTRYSSAGFEVDNAIAVDADAFGNVYVTGNTGFDSNSDMVTIKYNSTGVQQWKSVFDGSSHNEDIAKSMIVDESGNVYVTGTSLSFLSSRDYITIKYNSSGVIQWVSKYNGPANLNDIANHIEIDESGNVYITGKSDGIGTSKDYATVKYNSSGVIQWAARYNGTGNADDEAVSIGISESGNVFVTGQSGGAGTQSDFVSIKYDSSGAEQWIAIYDGPENESDAAYSLCLDHSENLYVTGQSEGSGTFMDYLTIKYDMTGAEQWIDRYNGPSNESDYANVIAINNLEKVFVSGGSHGIASAEDFTTIKYSESHVLNLTASLQGFYVPNSNTMISDTVTVYLRNINSPYAIVDSSRSKLNSSGTGTFNFENIFNGINYFIVVRHRNSIETWSSSGNIFFSGSSAYNFTAAANKAYGNNQIQVDNSPVRFGLYGGDVNKDGTVDLTDIVNIFNDANNFITGYVQNDVTGDNFVDLSDLTLAYNNSINFVSVVRP